MGWRGHLISAFSCKKQTHFRRDLSISIHWNIMSALTISIFIGATAPQSRAATGVPVFVIANVTGFFHAIIGLTGRYVNKLGVQLETNYVFNKNEKQGTYINSATACRIRSGFWCGLWSQFSLRFVTGPFC